MKIQKLTLAIASLILGLTITLVLHNKTSSTAGRRGAVEEHPLTHKMSDPTIGANANQEQKSVQPPRPVAADDTSVVSNQRASQNQISNRLVSAVPPKRGNKGQEQLALERAQELREQSIRAQFARTQEAQDGAGMVGDDTSGYVDIIPDEYGALHLIQFYDDGEWDEIDPANIVIGTDGDVNIINRLPTAPGNGGQVGYSIVKP